MTNGAREMRISKSGIIIMFVSGDMRETEPKQIHVSGKIARFTQIVSIKVFTAYLNGLNFILCINFPPKTSFEVQIQASIERNERARLTEKTELGLKIQIRVTDAKSTLIGSVLPPKREKI